MNDEFKDVQKQQLEINTRIDRDLNNLQSNFSVTKNSLANIFDSFDLKLNSTREKHLELSSKIRDHGHGNKQRIDDLASQITNLTIAFEMKTDDRIVGQNQKMAVLWINFLESKNLIEPILLKYGRTYAESIGARSPPQNQTDAIRYEIDQINATQLNETEYKRIVTDSIPDTFSVKLHPIDSNLKKVKYKFYCSAF